MDVKALLDEIKRSPYEEVNILAPHSGKVEFVIKETGTPVHGPTGTWNEVPGSLLANVERESNKKPVRIHQDGKIEALELDLEGTFVQAGTHLATLRHYLKKDEVLQIILRQALHLFPAPEKAKYYFVPEIESVLKTKDCQAIRVQDGMEMFIVSRMKRETALNYTGPKGIIYTIYFQPNENVDMGAPLIGVCPEDRVEMIQEVISRVQNEWHEEA